MTLNANRVRGRGSTPPLQTAAQEGGQAPFGTDMEPGPAPHPSPCPLPQGAREEKLCYDREIRHLASATSDFTMATQDELIISGARQNNLKNISLRIPHDQVTVITGVSGSGKSSLAFDTIFAEGQWRYIESLSAYARMFLERLDRPDVDRIEHIRPAIALEQKNPVRTARSTVGTATELHDSLRLLFAKVGRVHCPTCGSEARSGSAERVADELIRDRPSARALVCFSLPAAPRPDGRAFLATLVQRGFARIKAGDLVLDLAEAQVPGFSLPP